MNCSLRWSSQTIILTNDQQVLQYGKTVTAEERNIIADSGEERFYMTVKKPLFNQAGEIVGMFGVSTDITERKIMEQAIRHSHDMLDTILSNIDAFVYMKDSEYRFLYINAKTAELFNKDISEILGRNADELFPQDNANDFNQLDAQLFASGEKQVGEEFFVTANGEERYYWSTKIPLFNKQQQVDRYIGFSTDVTELSQLRYSLEQQVQEEISKRLQQEQLAITDPLTRLYNRFKLNESLDAELQRLRRYQQSVSIIINRCRQLQAH